jgi:hypothetical protein
VLADPRLRDLRAPVPDRRSTTTCIRRDMIASQLAASSNASRALAALELKR